MIGPKCHSNVQGRGYTDSGVMLCGIAPGRAEMNTGKVLTGMSGKLLDNFLEAAGWHRNKCYATNLVCTPNESPTLADFMECRPRYLEEVAQVKPKLLITLGTKVTEFFFPTRKASELRGCFIPYDDYYVLPTFHPAAILHAKENYNNIAIDLLNDLRKIPMFLGDFNSNNIENIKQVNYVVVSSIEQAQTILNGLPRDIPVSLDVETNNLDEDIKDSFTDNLLCFGIDDGSSTFVFPTNYAASLHWPTDVQWTFHYGIFDTQQILESAGVFLDIKHDSLLLHYCLDERSGRHKLKPIARRWCYAGFYEEKVDRRKLGTIPVETTMEYCAHDVAYTQRTATRLIPRVKAEGMWDIYTKLLLPAANIFKHIQRHGVQVDLDYLKVLAAEWLPIYKEKSNALSDEIVRLGGPPNLNLDSPPQLSKFLYDTLKLPGGPSTAKAVLELLIDEHPFVGQITEVRHLGHLLSTYIFGIADDVKRDGRVHPAPMIHGTVGGRLTYSNPTINTIPRPFEEQSIYGYKLRRLFTATDSDHVLIEIDQKQAEIWMAYINSQDPTLFSDLSTGDFHTSTAAFIKSLPILEVNESDRSDAKRTTFGKFFGIGIAKFAKQTKKPISEAREWNTRWDERYTGYSKWTEDVYKEAQNTGEVTTLTGRKRRFPLVLDTSSRNQMVNYKIQSPAHDVLLESEINLYWPLKHVYNAHILLDIHDAMIIEARKDNWKYVAEFAVKELTRSHFNLHPTPAEIKVGHSWGDSVEVEL